MGRSMVDKEIKDLTFDELVKVGIEKELDAIVRGDSLRDRVYSIMEIAVRWRSERTKAEEKSA